MGLCVILHLYILHQATLNSIQINEPLKQIIRQLFFVTMMWLPSSVQCTAYFSSEHAEKVFSVFLIVFSDMSRSTSTSSSSRQVMTQNLHS